jgi:hypothetical protein
MEFHCSHCGYRSTFGPFFRKERPFFALRARSFCAGCAPYDATDREKATFLLPVWLLPMGALVMGAVATGPASHMGLILVFWGLACLSAPLVIAIHEFGHATAAWLIGMRVVRVVIGSGPLIATRFHHRLAIELRRYPASGHIVAYPQRATAAKWPGAVFLLGGVAANAIAAAICAGILLIADSRAGSASYILLYVALWTNAGCAVLNLVPFTARRGRLPVPSDGKRLSALLRDRDRAGSTAIERAIGAGTVLLSERRYAEAHRLFDEAQSAHPDSTLLFGFSLAAMAEATSCREAMAWFLERPYRADPAKDGGPGPGAFVYATAAWIAVETRDPTMPPMALSLATSAVDLKVVSAEIDGIRAAALIANGDHRGGVPGAYDAMRRSENEEFRAELALFLADGLRAGGDPVTAEEVVRLASHLKAREDQRFYDWKRRVGSSEPVAA